MTVTILTIIAALVPFIIWLVKRHYAVKDDPKAIIQEQKDENRKSIADGDAGDLLMRRLNRLQGDKGSGPDNRPPAAQ